MGAKDKKKWIIAGLLCLMLWLLCGCTGKTKISIDTSLEVDENFKGQRVMSSVISDSLFRRAFNGDLEELQALLTEKCPSTLICSAEDVNNGVKITMTLEFASIKDYTNKIGQILEDSPGIYYDTSNSVFKKGYMIQENFSSADLFQWLVDAMGEEYNQLADSKLEDIFSDGKTQVVYGGETIDTKAEINVEKMDAHTFETLSVELTMNDDGSYGVSINFIADNEVYYDMGDDMDNAIKKLVPDGGVYDVTDVDEQRVYTIGFSAYNTETLLSQLNSVLKTKNCEFKVEENGDESDPFRANKVITIFLDGSYFLDFGNEKTELVYKINSGSEYSFNSCESLTGFLKEYSFDNSDKYTSVYMMVGPSDKVQVSLSYAIDMKEIAVNTKIINDTSMDRSLSFRFDSDKTSFMGTVFENKLRARMDEDMTLDVSEEKGIVSYTVNIHGSSAQELSEATTRFLDGTVSEEAPNSLMSGGKSNKKKLKTRAYTYEDRINFQQFLGSAVVENGIAYQLEYPKGYTASFEEGSHTDMVVDRNILSCRTKDQIIVVRSRGETVNISGITQLILWWTSLILSVIALVLNVKHLAGYIKYRQKYLLKADLFHGRNLIFLTVGVVMLTVFVFTSLRLIFRVY